MGCVTEKNHEEVRIICDSIAHWTRHLPNNVTASANQLGTMWHYRKTKMKPNGQCCWYYSRL